MQKIHKKNILNPDAINIEKLVAEIFNTTPEKLQQKTRLREVVLPRQVCMWWRYENTRESLAQIGARYNKDHATVLHAVKVINNELSYNQNMQEDIARLETDVSLYIDKNLGKVRIRQLLFKITDILTATGYVLDNMPEQSAKQNKLTWMHYELTSATGRMLEEVDGTI